MKNRRILILGNMANDGYAVAKELRKMNFEVDLAINSSDFGMAMPEWEDADITTNTLDPYKLHADDVQKFWHSPGWIRRFDLLNNKPRKKFRFQKSRARIGLLRMIREYDVIESHVPYPILTQFTLKPFVVYDAGWIRYFPYAQTLHDKLARRAYKKARQIIYTNPDTYEIFEKQSYIKMNRLKFCPFAIDPEKYKPMNADDIKSRYVSKSDDVLLFSPSRQIWSEKGNDKMLRAYTRFSKDFPNSRFIIVSWSVDEQRSHELAKELGIYEKIHWIKPMPKNQLIQYYNAADIILDQFVLGSWETSTPEAMSCGKNVLMFFKKDYVLRAFGEQPPILNSFTEDEISANLLRLAKDKDLREHLGQESRDWIIKTHHPQVVANTHLRILRDAL